MQMTARRRSERERKAEEDEPQNNANGVVLDNFPPSWESLFQFQLWKQFEVAENVARAQRQRNGRQKHGAEMQWTHTHKIK